MLVELEVLNIRVSFGEGWGGGGGEGGNLPPPSQILAPSNGVHKSASECTRSNLQGSKRKIFLEQHVNCRSKFYL